MSQDNIDKLFSAFIITKNKVPCRAYKNPENHYTYDQIKGLPEYAGMLSERAILVDVDDEVEGAKLVEIIKALNVKCRVHKTTRGVHAFFLGHNIPSTKTQKPCAIGLTVDVKLGTKSGICILKKDNKEREVLYETEEIGPLPAWLTPIRYCPTFMEMGEGDGRNDALFQHILTLQAAGLTKDEAKDAIRIINAFVLRDQLPEREIETILRDDSFPSESFYDDKGKLQVRKFEEHFMRECYGIKLDKNLHIYRDGVYVNGDEMIRGKMLDFLPDLTFSQRNEILNRSKDRIQTFAKRAPAYLIAFQNGTFDVRSGTLGDHNPDNVITNIIAWDYNPDAYSEVADRTLDKLACNDPSTRMLLEEIIGYCFYRRNEIGKAFLLLGDASNGKSTYLSIVRTIIGEDNVASLNLQDLTQRFKPAELFNKMANIGDDIPETWVPDPSMFKKVVTGDRISAEFKGLNSFEFCPYTKMLFSANNMPRIEDKTGAVKRRIIPVPFKAVFSPTDPDYDPYIKDKLTTTESMEYFIRIGVEGLRRVLDNNGFTVTPGIMEELENIDKQNNPIIGFLEDIGEDAIFNHSTKEVYDRYRDYCIESGMQAIALPAFVKQINKRLGTTVVRKMVDKVPYKIFKVKE